MQSHLGRCDSCRLELHRLKSALAEIRHLSTPAHPDDHLEAIWQGVRQRIVRWETARLGAEKTDEAIRSRVAIHIAPFLGNAAARKTLQPIQGDHRHFLAGAEGVLGEFLGHAAAATLVNRVVDEAIVKI